MISCDDNNKLYGIRHTVVDQWSNQFSIWPLSFWVKLFSKLVPAAIIRSTNLWDISVKYRLVEMQDELEPVRKDHIDYLGLD